MLTYTGRGGGLSMRCERGAVAPPYTRGTGEAGRGDAEPDAVPVDNYRYYRRLHGHW